MERKIGETFEFKGKTYKVVKFNGCANCAFKYNNCPNLTHAIGNCIDFQRSDGAKVMFEEIKGNKLTIDIPEGMEIDLQNSNFDTGVICFKKKQPEFKDGDILYAEKDESHTDGIFIKKTVKGKIGHYACLILHPYMVCKYSRIGFIGNKTLRYATKKEKQQLFDALAKENKAWDAEKKQIVDLKPKVAEKKQIVDLKPKVDELKPFDKVLVKDSPYGSWEPALFWKKVDVKDLHPYKIIGGKRYRYYEPYEGNECLLDNK